MKWRQTHPNPARNPWPTFALCSLAVFLVMLDTTILFVAFHGIRRSFAAVSNAELSWILNAYTIVFGTLLVPGGRLAALPDIPGTLMLSIGVGAIALGVVKSTDWGWPSTSTEGAIVTGLVVLAVFVVWASRVDAPALDLTLFRDTNYRFANIATFVFSVTFTAMFFGFFFFMTRVWGYALPRAGLAVTPGPLMVIPVAILAGRRAARIGHRPLLVLGGVVYALGAAWIYATAGPTPDFLRHWLPGMLLGGTGVGLVLPSLAGAAVFGLPPQRFGVGSAVNQAIRQMGAVFGVALVVVLVGNAFGPTAMESFRIHFRVLIAGGLATALLSLPIDTRPGREAADARPQPQTIAGAEERAG